MIDFIHELEKILDRVFTDKEIAQIYVLLRGKI